MRHLTCFPSEIIGFEENKSSRFVDEAKDEALRVIFFYLRFHSSMSMDTGKDVALLADLFKINKGTDAAQ